MTKALSILSVLAFLTLTAGCDTAMVTQYRVTSVSTERADENKLLESLARVASQIGLEDTTPTSVVKDTLVFYSQPKVEHFKVQLGARRVGNSVIVELIGGFGPITPDYVNARNLLLDEMTRNFQGHYEIPSPIVPMFYSNGK